jgi:hypothetical protein
MDMEKMSAIVLCTPKTTSLFIIEMKSLLIRISIALSMAYDIVSRVYANPVKEFMTLVQGNLKDRQNVITGSESGRYIIITI